MSTAENPAVFLSYASQDAAAAQRICAALRAAGVEVWFDQNELTGGDAWDQKIRGQVASCALFLPVISAATQARREGYFRIEWKLAAQRTHAMADGTPFLLPVVIDATKDGDALVPVEFKAVQWTRLPDGETPEKFCARVKALLGGESSSDVGRGRRTSPSDDTRPQPAGFGDPALHRNSHRRIRTAAWIAAAVVVLGVAYFILRPRRSPEEIAALIAKAQAIGAEAAKKSAAPAAVWPRDAELRHAMELVNGIEGIAEDFVLAEEIANKALAKNSTDPEAVTVMARVQVAFLFRGFDRSDERRATAQRYAERAVQLGINDPEALGALGVFLIHARGGDFVRARELLERAIALKPGEPFFHRHRDNGLFLDTKIPEAEAVAATEKTAALFPDDPLAQYELGRHYRDLSRIEDAERAFDRALALAPIANAIVWKARVALWVRGDPSEMKTILARVPARQRATERVVLSRWTHAMVSGETDDALEGLSGLTGKWVEDFEYNGPKALLIAQLLERQGKRALARLQYESALNEVRARQVKAPTDAALRGLEAWILHGLGRDSEALPLSRVELEATGRPYAYARLGSWWFSILPRCLLLAEKGTALQLIREAVTPMPGPRRLADDPSGSLLTEAPNLTRSSLRLRFKLDPRMAPFRDDPEIVALLAEPAAAAGEKKTVAAPVPLSEGAQLAARALALAIKTGFTREDLAVAEDFAKRATEKEPDSAAAWGVRAGVQSAWIFRNWDAGEKRRQETQSLANKALALDANEPEALLALSHVLRAQGAFDQAAAHLRRAVAAHPDHVRLARSLGFTLMIGRRDDEARAVLRDLAQRVPRDPLVRYELAMSYTDYSTRGARGGAQEEIVGAALEQLDMAIAIQPFASALLLKATLLAGWRGDLPGMRATLEQLEKLSLAERSEDRTVCLSMWAGLIERRPERVEAAAALTARTYFEDGVMPLRPKAWSLALAYRLAGKENLARREWQAAETVLRERLKDQPANPVYQAELAITLAWLGQREEAARLMAAVEPVWREDPRLDRLRLLSLYHAVAGDAAKTVSYLTQTLDRSVFMARKIISLDPWWDKVRDAPEFVALLKEPAAK